MMDKLGEKYTMDIYHLQDECKKVEKISNPKEIGIFFQKENYIVDLKGQARYLINWQGTVNPNPAKAREQMNKLCNYEASSDVVRYDVRNRQEPQDFI